MEPLELNNVGAKGALVEEAQGKWGMVGLIALYDPAREDSAETIDTAKSMGIDVKMITGDHVAVAKEIASVSLGVDRTETSRPTSLPAPPKRTSTTSVMIIGISDAIVTQNDQEPLEPQRC